MVLRVIHGDLYTHAGVNYPQNGCDWACENWWTEWDFMQQDGHVPLKWKGDSIIFMQA